MSATAWLRPLRACMLQFQVNLETREAPSGNERTALSATWFQGSWLVDC